MEYLVLLIAVMLLVPLMILIFGIIFIKKPPKTINSIYGYRTEYSTKSQDTWDFAHKMMGKLWVIIGTVLLPLSFAVPIIFNIFFMEQLDAACAVIVWVQVISIILSIIPVEQALKRSFDANGNKK